MPLIFRAAALSLLLVVLPLQPAAAAPPAATAEPHLGQVTLATGGPEKNILLWVRLKNVVLGEPVPVEVTVDLGGATSFADIQIGPGFDLPDGPSGIDLVVDPDDQVSPCRRTGEKILCSWTTAPSAAAPLIAPAVLTLTPGDSAKAGDRADVTMTAKVGDGAVTNGSSVIRMGEGVDLVADEDMTIKAAPGQAVKLGPTVRNAGTTTVEGVALALVVNPLLLGRTSYRNCRYDIFMICSFDTKIEPGRRYALSTPLTLRAPADSVPGSAAYLASQWMTTSEYEDFQPDDFGTPGTGGTLTLEATGAAQDDQPQAEVRPENNYTNIEFTVSGTRRPRLAAVGSSAAAPVGDHRTLSAGVMNFGPGTLRPSLFWNNSLYVAVRMPGNVVTAGEPAACDPEKSDDQRYCRMEQDLGAGQRASFAFPVTVAGQCGDPGMVEVLTETDEGAGLDRNRKLASLSVSVPGATCVALPITGPGAGRTGLAGVALIAVGLLLAVRRTRRSGYPQARK